MGFVSAGNGAAWRGAERRGWKTGISLAVLMLSAGACGILTTSTTAQAQSELRSYAIAAQPLSSALLQFSSASGIEIFFDQSLATGRSSAGLSGSHPVDAALEQLLAGSGLGYRYTNATTITVYDPTAEAGDVSYDGSIVLEEVNVTAWVEGAGAGWDGSAETVYTTPGSVAYISQETISRFSGTGSGDIFKSTPGVIAAANHNGSSIDVNIRGLQGQNRVKVAIDGTQQSTTTWRGYLGVDERVYIDPDLIGGVSIEKGPTGGAAGAGIIGGVVAMRTLNAGDIVAEGQTVGARLRLGTSDNAIDVAPPVTLVQRTEGPSFFDFENGSASGAVAVKEDNFEFTAAVARRQSGNYFAGSEGETHYRNGNGGLYPLSYTKPGEEVFNSSESTFTALLKGLVRWDDHSLELGYIHHESEFGESLGSLLTAGDNSFRQVQLANASTDTYTARYRWNPEDDLYDLRFNVWATDVAATTRSVGPAFYLPPWITPETRPPADDPRFSETWTYGADLTNTSRFSTGLGALTADFGASYVLEDMDGEPYYSRIYANDTPVVMNPSVGTREVASLFSRGVLDVTDWLQVSGGLRYDAFRIEEKGEPFVTGSYSATYADRMGGRLNPSAGITLTPLDGVQFYGLYAEGVRPPSLRETIGSDSLLAPNPDLRPEVARNWEFGVNYSQDGLLTKDDKARLKLSYFVNTYEDYISRVNNPNPAPGSPFYSTANLDSAMFSGIEISGSYDLGPVFAEASLTHYTGFEFCRTEATCSSSAISNDYANNHLPPETAASLTLGMRLLEEKLTVGGRVNYAGGRLGPAPTSSQATNYWLPYAVVDAFLTYEVNDNLSVDLKVENLFDRYYIDALDGWMPAPGRTVRASMTASF